MAYINSLQQPPVSDPRCPVFLILFVCVVQWLAFVVMKSNATIEKRKQTALQ